MGVAVAGETPSLTGEFVGETHRVLDHTQAHLPGNQYLKGTAPLWVAKEVTDSDSGARAEQAALFPLGLFPHIQHHNAADKGFPALANT